MAISFPTSLDSFTDIECADTRTPKDVVNDLFSAVEALESKVGIDSSAVNTSHDFKLSGVSDGDYAASLAGTETLTNKTLTTPKVNENVAVTATATEINVLDGITSNTNELNILDGVTATAGELNYNDITTLGTVEASKTVTADANKVVDFDGGSIQGWDGWIPVDDSWTYASATTVTVPSDATAKYKIGDRVEFTNTTDKSFVIVGVASTTLTLFGGSDYTVANAAISSIRYSKNDNPIGFPRLFNIPLTLSVSSGTAPTFTAEDLRTCVIDTNGLATIFFQLRNTSGGTAGSGANPLIAELPLSISTSIAGATNGDISFGTFNGFGNSTSYFGIIRKNTGVSNQIRFTDIVSVANLTGTSMSGTTRVLAGTFSYLING